jgi:hypothetical protein
MRDNRYTFQDISLSKDKREHCFKGFCKVYHPFRTMEYILLTRRNLIVKHADAAEKDQLLFSIAPGVTDVWQSTYSLINGLIVQYQMDALDE